MSTKKKKRYRIRYIISSRGYIRKQFSDGHVEFVDPGIVGHPMQGSKLHETIDDALQRGLYAEIPTDMARAAGAIK